MKTSKLKISVAFLFALALSFAASAGLSMEPFSKKVSKSFTLEKDGTVKLLNKHGTLHITTWDKPDVSIDVEVQLEARNTDKGQKMLDEIKINLDKSENQVRGIVEFTGKGNFKELEINMTVKMPKWAALNAINKFGDFYINELDARSKIRVAYGTMNIGVLKTEENELSIAYGSANISYVEFAQFKARYSEYKIKKSRWIKLDSKFSEANIGGVGRLDFDCAYDEISVKGVGVMKGRSKFSEFSIDKVTKEFDITNAYGEIDIDLLEEGFEKVKISSSFADISISVDPKAQFYLAANASFADISVPRNESIHKSQGMNSEKYSGHYGGESENIIKVSTSYGDFRLGYTNN